MFVGVCQSHTVAYWTTSVLQTATTNFFHVAHGHALALFRLLAIAKQKELVQSWLLTLAWIGANRMQ
jgi:hypothetical protein